MKTIVWIVSLLVAASIANAAQESPKGKIIGYYTGWAYNNVRIRIDGANYTEVPSCTTHDGYVVEGIQAGTYEAHTSALLAAYMAGKEVRLILHDTECVNNRPKIIGVYID